MPQRNNIAAWLRRLFGRKMPPSEAGAPAPVALHRLLYLLLPTLETQGFLLSPDRYITLQRMLAAMPPDMPLREWRNLLCPVLATDLEQQRIFYDLFDRFEAQINREAGAEKAAAQPEPPVEKPGVDTAPNTHSQQPKTPPASARDVRIGDEAPAARRPLVVELDECTDPPFSWNIVADSEGIPIEVGPQFGRTLIQLRRRETAGYLLPDLPASVRATIAEGGVPTFRYRSPTRPTEYLLLVERYATDDHRAALFDHFYHTLRHNDVIIERFFYQGDLRLCRNEHFPAGLSLPQLRYRYPDARLVVMGVGHRFISPKTSEPAQWTRALYGWRRRMLLTPVPRQEWGARERALQHLFNLLPASLHSLHFLSDAPDEALHGGYEALPEYVRRIAEVEPLKIEEPVMRALRRHFDPGQLCWIATCAVYPALHYELTLRLGKKMSESLGYNLLTATNLLALARLPWFTEGRIPPQARTQLIEWLEHRHPEQHREVLDYLHALMENNPPPERSAAWAEHQINLALLNAARSLNPDAETLAQLRAVVKRLDHPQKRGDFVLPRQWEAMLDKIGFSEEIVSPPQPDSAPPLHAGMIFAEQYRLEVQLSQGAFWQIWQATIIEPVKEEITKGSFESAESPAYPRGGWLMAIKIFTGGERYYDYCIQEFKQTNRLEHPHIIRLYDCGMWNGLPWQTMPLHRPVAAAGEWEEDELWRLLRDMADALTYLHAHKPPISHNDIKPGQFLQDEDGAYLLADFGISGELLQVAARDIRPTVNPEFLPPECRSDIYYRSLATDVYALGASLYYLATGRPPVPGRSGMTSQSDAPAGPAPLPTQFSGDLNYLLMQCLSDVPAERPTAEKIRQVAGDRLAEGGLTTDGLDSDTPVRMFIAYARKDADMLKEMRTHLAPLMHSKQVEVWVDDEINAGELWDDVIRQRLRSSDIILLLVSVDAIASDYFYDKEMADALERHRKGSARVVPMIVRPCAWKATHLAELQALPKDGKPVTSWSNRDEAFADAIRSLSNIIDDIAERKQEMVQKAGIEEPSPTTSASISLPDMVFVPGGTFTMGWVKERDGEGYNSEKPAHEVTVKDFYIGKYPVTQSQWRTVMGSDPPELNNKGCDQCPVERVSWDDIQEFLKKLNEMTGKQYRLPTEAEWEYAARGGKQSKGYLYSGSNNLDEVAWYDKNYKAGNTFGEQKTTRPVGGKKPNELGLYDMSGNVWEWCEDDWHSNYNGAPVDGSAWVDSSRASNRVYRGGGWNNTAGYCRAADRRHYTPTLRSNNLGFRLALQF
ncbi:MAG: SUMF1/EgtB/PvdO family nonheme iron enzyme [Saprospiraceae bacterium]|nr:SUMF1/EgtB/PvdO family nonheme iron enzyme [Saprospiraceae bacterium]